MDGNDTPVANPVDLGAIAEDSGSYVITAAQLLAATVPANQGLFSPTSVPDMVFVNDPTSVELGIQFTASTDGSISGVQFYKGPANTGPHLASLWTSDGTLLATATFTDEASGWQQVSFEPPVAIEAGETYVASYHTSGNYSATSNYFNDLPPEGHLSVPNAAGVFAYGTGPVFPSSTFNATNYWVDVVFNAPVSITALTLDSGNGTLVDNHDGTWTYTPAANDDSAASFSYTTSDGLHGASSTASLDITPVNDAPVAVADTLAATEDTPVIYSAADLLGNDTDVDNPNSALSIVSVTSGTGGTTVLNLDGTVTFTPNADFNGAADFSYTVSDGTNTSAPATATVNVTPVNDAPVAVADTLAATEDTPVTYSAADLLGNDTDVDNPNSALSIASVISGTGGTTVLNLDGTVTFTPNADFNGAADFSYTVSDGTNTSAPATATVNVTPVNDAPLANPVDLGAIAEDSPGRVITEAQLLAGVTDVDGPAASITALTLTSGNGTLHNNNNGTWTYRPATNDHSAASFSYTASDGQFSASSTASLDITPVNDAPLANPVNLGAIAEDSTGRVITAAQLLAGVADVDGPAASITALTLTSGNGTLHNNNNGTWTYRPATNDHSAASFSYTASDGQFSASSTASLDITPVNDAPTAVVLSNIRGPLAENASTAVHIKVADIAVSDVDGGTNNLSLSGLDASLFEIVGTTLWIKAGALFDFETNPRLDVTVNVNDPTVGGAIDAQASLSIAIGDVIETVSGTAGANALNGAAFAETFSGLAGNDRINGNGGNDRIAGGLGADILTGGAGGDVFVFSSISKSAPSQSGLVNNSSFGATAGQGLRDIITDFTHGLDKLDLSAIDANTKVAGNQAFTWRGTGNFTTAPGQLIERLYDAAGTANDKTIIYGDVNGDARADFQIELTGLKTITVSDFIL